MIYGIGTDIVQISRMDDFWARHGDAGLEKILAPDEREACRLSKEPGRFLAKRFAAKEALGKAFGTGLRAPILMPEIAVVHDGQGKPSFTFSAALAEFFVDLGLAAHLSISDEQQYAVAFAILEKA